MTHAFCVDLAFIQLRVVRVNNVLWVLSQPTLEPPHAVFVHVVILPILPPAMVVWLAILVPIPMVLVELVKLVQLDQFL